MDEFTMSQIAGPPIPSDSELSEREVQVLLRAWQEELRRSRWDAAFSGLVTGLKQELS